MVCDLSGQTHGDIWLPMEKLKDSGVQLEVHPALYSWSYR